MERKVTAEQAENQFGTMLKGVCKAGDNFVVEQDGEPVAAVVPYWMYKQWMERRKAFFDRAAAIAERVNMDPDEAMELALEAQREVRREMALEREQQQQ